MATQMSFDFSAPVFVTAALYAKCHGISLSHANKLLNRLAASGRMVKDFRLEFPRSSSLLCPPPVRTAIYREV